MLLMLIAGSAVLGHFITVTNIPMYISEWVMELPVHKNIILVVIFFVYLIGGSFIDDLAFMILATPSSTRRCRRWASIPYGSAS
jgi:TRAP-type C4-dicarboxylate transport system permease large subunit